VHPPCVPPSTEGSPSPQDTVAPTKPPRQLGKLCCTHQKLVAPQGCSHQLPDPLVLGEVLAGGVGDIHVPGVAAAVALQERGLGPVDTDVTSPGQSLPAASLSITPLPASPALYTPPADFHHPGTSRAPPANSPTGIKIGLTP